MKNYTVILTTNSPIFIGNGLTISKKEYIFNKFENKVYIPDMVKMFNFLTENNLLNDYEDYLLRDNIDFAIWLRNKNIKNYKEFCIYDIDCQDVVFENRGKKEIMPFIKDKYNKPYIPASSLKGAIRTALLSAEIMQKPNKFSRYKQDIEHNNFSDKRNRLLARETTGIEQTVFNTLGFSDKKYNAVNDVLSGLIIGDSEPLSTDDLVLCQKIDVTISGAEKKLPILRECIKPNTKIKFSLTIDNSRCQYTKEMILNALNSFVKQYNDNFRNHFMSNAYHGDCNIYLGGGCGYATKTFMYPLFGKTGVKLVAKTIDATLPNPKIRRQHGHRNDFKVSPHMLKCTVYQNALYEMGACSLEIQ